MAGCNTNGRHTPPSGMPQIGAPFRAADDGGQEGNNGADADIAPHGLVRLEDALAAALLGNPTLALYAIENRAAEARALQAGLLPNPELDLQVGEYNRNDEGFDAAETTIVLAQLLEIGGKRQWRRRVAEANYVLSDTDYEIQRLDVIAETARRFMDVLAAQERATLAAAAVEIAQAGLLAVREGVKAGKESPLQAVKGETDVELARLDERGARNAEQMARRRLAAMWGHEEAAFEAADGNLYDMMETIPSLETLRAELAETPDLARTGSELRLRRATLASEKAARVPDARATVGFQRFEADTSDALVFGVGMPLPVFDRNQGNIAAAAQALAKAEAEARLAEFTLAADLADAHASLTAVHERATALRDTVVPAMEKAFAAAQEEYRQGKFGVLHMRDAERGLMEAKQALIDTMSLYHTTLIKIQRITGIGPDALDDRKKEKQR